jgi:hypothetical protein
MHARIPGGKGFFWDLLERAAQVDKIHLFLSAGVGILLGDIAFAQILMKIAATAFFISKT